MNYILYIPSAVSTALAHEAKAMVLTCMDFCLLDDVTRLIDAKGYTNNYDGFILAG